MNINRWITFRTKVAYFFLPDILLLFITGRHICVFCFMPWYNWTIVESAVKHHNSLSLWIMLPSIQWVNQYKLYKNSYSHTNAPNLHDITEILLKMALNTITLSPITPNIYIQFYSLFPNSTNRGCINWKKKPKKEKRISFRKRFI